MSNPNYPMCDITIALTTVDGSPVEIKGFYICELRCSLPETLVESILTSKWMTVPITIGEHEVGVVKGIKRVTRAVK